MSGRFLCWTHGLLAGAMFAFGLALGLLLAQAEIDRLEFSLGQFALLLQGLHR